MHVLTRYEEAMIGAILGLYEKRGLHDPSVPEIACALLRKPLPDDPITWPDTLGGEVYDGVAKRLPRLRSILDERGHMVAPLGYQYYKMGLRKAPIEPSDVRICIPNGGARHGGPNNGGGRPDDNRPYGILFVAEGEENPIYAEYLRVKVAIQSTMIDNTGRHIEKGTTTGAIAHEDSMKLLDTMDKKITHQPRDVRERLTSGTAKIT